MFKEAAGRAVPQRAASEETRRQILETALALFRERGFEETTIRDIASRRRPVARRRLLLLQEQGSDRRRLLRLRAGGAPGARRARRSPGAATFATGCARRLHTKIDIMQEDRRLLRALFRYGGDPEHPLSWFGPATREQRQLSVAVFAEALAGERLPDDVREAAPTLLWTLHMGILLYFLYDASTGPAPDAQADRRRGRLRRRRQASRHVAAAASDAAPGDDHPARRRAAHRGPAAVKG